MTRPKVPLEQLSFPALIRELLRAICRDLMADRAAAARPDRQEDPTDGVDEA